MPGQKPSRTQSLVELMDLYPTLARAAGLRLPPGVQGKDLAPILRDPQQTVRTTARSMVGKKLGLRTAKWAYMNYGKQIEELYDMDADPEQFSNLASEGEHEAVLKRFRREARSN